MKYVNGILGGLATVAVLAVSSHAGERPSAATGPPCARHTEFVAYLASVYGEEISGRGLRGDGVVLELFTGPSGSWTIIVTHPAGVSCAIAEGTMWETLPRSAQGAALPGAAGKPSGSL